MREYAFIVFMGGFISTTILGVGTVFVPEKPSVAAIVLFAAWAGFFACLAGAVCAMLRNINDRG